MATEYYYFVTGLPAQSPDDTKLLMTPLMFLQSAKEHLDAADYKLLELLLVPNDITNLIGILHKQEHWSDENSIDKDEWLALIEHIKELSDTTNLKKKHLDDHVLPLIIEYLSIYLRQEETKPEYILYKELFTLFYDWVDKYDNPFVREWFCFDRDLRNIIIALNCRKHNLPAHDQLIGNNEVTRQILKSNAADFGLAGEYSWFDLVGRLTDQPDIVDKEKGYDALRWKWLDDKTFFDYFTIPRIMAYFIRLRIVYRWIHLSQAVGEKRFGQVLHDLETSFEFPEEFALNKR